MKKLKELENLEIGEEYHIFGVTVEGDEVNKAYNEDGTEIPTETVDDLWNIVEKFRK